MIGGSGNATLSATGGTNVTLFGGTRQRHADRRPAPTTSRCSAAAATTPSAPAAAPASPCSAAAATTAASSNGNQRLDDRRQRQRHAVRASGGTSDHAVRRHRQRLADVQPTAPASPWSAAAATPPWCQPRHGIDAGSAAARQQHSLTSASGGYVDHHVGGSGNDTLSATGGTSVTLFGGTGNDSLVAVGRHQRLDGRRQRQQHTVRHRRLDQITMFGGTGNDSLQARPARLQRHPSPGGSGNDTLTAVGDGSEASLLSAAPATTP